MGKLVDMEMDDERQFDHPTPIAMPQKSRYPYGLRICLCCEELEKLGLYADCDVGDYLDIRAFATVTSVHKEDGSKRVELQIEKMAIENESSEEAEDEEDSETY
jgi:hypothetical protein